MTTNGKRVGFILGAAVLVASAGIVARAQNTSPSFAAQGGPGGPGGPGGGPGGPGGGPGGRRGGGPPGPSGPMMGRGGPGGVDLPLGQLNLSAQQRDQVKSIVESHQDEMKAFGDREMAAREALEAAVSADTLDEGAIRNRAAEVGAVEADMAIARAHLRAEVFQLLTPEQKTKAKELASERPRPGRGPGRGRV